ncbi:hypothetical protein MIND_01008700 [Mycena indigotica]|uniref:CxC5 like cysteine cluster associated with KDZ domain-containing protein n=1 Tax=Mycena indigotica TaxID=2126181 RepID=A0A8H6W0B1_9AGAR|nr:uncharacterized protein MIND_01008700 [Mycena indigotica]KAF7294714.1 hypothetical protein MIND_01008700 [Mycena indigotica]
MFWPAVVLWPGTWSTACFIPHRHTQTRHGHVALLARGSIYGAAFCLLLLPYMSDSLPYETIVRFIELARLIKPALSWYQPEHIMTPLAALPDNYHTFFMAAFDLSDSECRKAWTSLRERSWAYELDDTELLALRTKYLPVFLTHGIPREIGLYSFDSPHRSCKDEACAKRLYADPNASRSRDLSSASASRVPITVFTKEFGALPDFATSRKCTQCNTRYYHNYLVDKNWRHYYPGSSIDFMQVSGHFYMHRDVAELFASMKVNAWTSGTNCAKIYNESNKGHAIARFLPPDWPYNLQLDVEKVWDDMIADGIEGTGADEDEDVEIDEDGVCPDKPSVGNQKPKARFGRRRTHNEELCVMSCGVIVGRATFYGSEAPNGVRKFWKRLFPTQRSLPQVLWHDNNCRIVAMLRSQDDDYFKNCALPVDVFHFKCKHKESDIECGRYCNPYRYTQLRTKEGSWRFNSSAAEQTNAWFGGFQAIVQEMSAERYDFFLDEMIRRRNMAMVELSRQRGHNPHSIPRSALL